MLRGVHHVSLNVNDAEVSRRFYTEVLGLETLPRPDLGPGYWLGLPDGGQIHVIETEGWTAPEGQHFAVRVDDIDAVRATLTGRGVEVGEPFELPGVGRQAFLQDPDGNVIELNQPNRP